MNNTEHYPKFEFDMTPVASSVVVYYDNDYNVVKTKEEGCRARISEFDADGNLIREVWGTYTNEDVEQPRKVR